MDDLDRCLRSVIFAGLVGIGHLLNLESTTRLLASLMDRQVAALLATAGLALLWIAILVSVVVRIAQQDATPPHSDAARPRVERPKRRLRR